MSHNIKISNQPEQSALDVDLARALKETKSFFEQFVQIRKDLRCSQLETKLLKDQLESTKKRNENCNAPSDWNRMSKKLNNIINVIGNRKDIANYERSIRELSDENETLKKELNDLKANHLEAVEREKEKFKAQLDRETAQYTKQISELMLHRELAESEASIKCDQLQARLERSKEEKDECCRAITAQYEKLLHTLTEQKQQLREENHAHLLREQQLLCRLEYVQTHSTNFLLGMGPSVPPIGSSIAGSQQRVTAVVETVPLERSDGASQRSSQIFSGSSNTLSASQKKFNSQKLKDVIEVSSTTSAVRARENRLKQQSSPQHPGLGNHIAKPRKRRKLLTQPGVEN
ncbi:girdin-like [Toxorhynchites rutilus septentrionalis]|uniref:girdin-like n=1 Tax=Toxorhynchites rutilus septentrionalis TaxID=329112 RepID=UPI0024799E31|nr:girdin-like [Toxorhynchites rutilus septentrionalis]